MAIIALLVTHLVDASQAATRSNGQRSLGETTTRLTPVEQLLTVSWRNNNFGSDNQNPAKQFIQMLLSFMQLFLALCAGIDGQAPLTLTVMMAINAVAGLYSFFGYPVEL